MADKTEKDTSAQTFSFETVAVLVANIFAQGGSLGMNDYKRMSALDGSRGASSFDHMFRKVKNRAKELNEQAKEAGDFTPVKKAKAAGGGGLKKVGRATTSGKKRARTTKKDDANAAEEEVGEESPSKKVKGELEEDGEADAPSEPNYEFQY